MGVYIITFAICLIIIKILLKYPKQIGLLDVPNGRSSHSYPIPRSGGIAIVCSVMIGLFVYKQNFIMGNIGFALSIMLVAVVGIIDDYKDVSYKYKFTFLFIAACIAYYDGYKIITIGNFFYFTINLSYFSIPFTLFVVVGYTNASNLMDGLDGLSSQLNMVILSSFIYFGHHFNDEILATVSMILLFAILGFWLFNRNPAKIFQGDMGALTTGFIIALLSIRLIQHINPASILFFAFVPIADTLIVMVRRYRVGKSPFKPDKTHLHHMVMRIKFKNVKKSVNLLTMIQVIFTLVGLKFTTGDQLITVVIFFIAVYVFYQLFTATQFFEREKREAARLKKVTNEIELEISKKESKKV